MPSWNAFVNGIRDAASTTFTAVTGRELPHNSSDALKNALAAFDTGAGANAARDFTIGVAELEAWYTPGPQKLDDLRSNWIQMSPEERTFFLESFTPQARGSGVYDAMRLATHDGDFKFYHSPTTAAQDWQRVAAEAKMQRPKD